MDIQLTNRCRMDGASMRKSFKKFFRSRDLIMVFFIVLLLAAWVSYLAVVPPARQGAIRYAAPALAVVYAVLTFIAPIRNSRIYMRRLKETWNTDSYEATTTFEPDALVCHFSHSGSVVRLSYQNIGKILEDDPLILIKTKARQFYSLDRTRFENGTEDDFWRLMNEKCPQAVPKKHCA